MKIAVKLIKTEWPPNSGVMPGDPQFDAMFDSVKKDGIHEPITINIRWFVIDGCHRLSVARHLGIEYIDCRVWTGTEFVI